MRKRRFDWISFVAALTSLLAVGATLLLAQARNARLADDRRDVRRYAETISPLAFEGGRVIQERVKPSLTDILERRVTAAEYRRRAASWKHDLEEIRKAFNNARVPPRLTGAARTFDEALRGYVEAIDAFIRASETKGTEAEIEAALQPGITLARKADATYDRARQAVQAELRRVGLPETTFS